MSLRPKTILVHETVGRLKDAKRNGALGVGSQAAALTERCRQREDAESIQYVL